MSHSSWQPPAAASRLARRGWQLPAAVAIGATLLGATAAAPASAARLTLPAPVSAATAADLSKLIVKFRDDTDVAAAGKQLSFKDRIADARVDRILASAKAKRIAPVFEGGSKLDTRRDALKAKGKRVPDLTSFFTITLEPGESAANLIERLTADPLVQSAYVPGRTVPASPEDLRTFQSSYWSASPAGLGIAGATGNGVLGEHVKVISIEKSIDTSHEDFDPAHVHSLSPPGGSDTNHGTAVAGIIAARRDSVGIDGIVPETDFSFLAEGYSVANATIQSLDTLEAGDVLLYELQVNRDGTSALFPVESDEATRAAITTAVASGVIVVEPAGNYNVDLDDPTYGGAFSPATDSGAIIVGAGAPTDLSCMAPHVQPARTRLNFPGWWGSNYGSRVDVQAPGVCVAATGYGDLSSFETGPGNSYGWFAGTSSASAVTAGVVAALSSVHEGTHGGEALTPEGARTALKRTGTPQVTSATYSGNIGPQLNLTAAIQYLADAPDTTILTGQSGGITGNPRPTYTFSGSPAGVTFECRFVPVGIDGAQTPPFAPCSGSGTHTAQTDLPDGNNRFEVRAVRAVGGVDVVDVSPATRTLGILSTNGSGAAGTVSVTGGVLAVNEVASRTNAFDIKVFGAWVVIEDSGDVLRSTSPACQQMLITVVRCPLAGLTQLNLNAGALDDSIKVNVPFATTLRGGADDDSITSKGAGADAIYPDSGYDSLSYEWSTAGVNVSFDGIANDGPTGNDNVFGNFESLLGGPGNDTLSTMVPAPLGTEYMTELWGGAGDDVIQAGQSGAWLHPGDGDDTVKSGPGPDMLSYQEREDDMVVNLNSSASGTDVAAGNDTLIGASFDNVWLGFGNDQLQDSPKGEIINDFGGNDLFVMSGGGADTVYAQYGDDTFTDGPGNDHYFGGSGNDRFTPTVAGGSDHFHGGDGTDLVDMRWFTGNISATTDDATNDGVIGSGGQLDNIDADVENINTGSGNDTINTAGRTAGGTLRGYGGNDTITGSSFDDVLIGNAGTDTLVGGDGNDRLESRDTVAGETVNCGNGADLALVDVTDILTSCETLLS